MTTTDIDRLSPPDRLDLIGRLWDSLDSTDVPMTKATLKIQRIAILSPRSTPRPTGPALGRPEDRLQTGSIYPHRGCDSMSPGFRAATQKSQAPAFGACRMAGRASQSGGSRRQKRSGNVL
jgi:hypothetical protein